MEKIVVSMRRTMTEDQKKATYQADLMDMFGIGRGDRQGRPNRKTGKRFYNLFSVRMKLVKEF